MMMKKSISQNNDNSNQTNKDDEEKSRKKIGTGTQASCSSTTCAVNSGTAITTANSKSGPTPISPGVTCLALNGSAINSKLAHLKMVNQMTSNFLHNPNRATATTAIPAVYSDNKLPAQQSSSCQPTAPGTGAFKSTVTQPAQPSGLFVRLQSINEVTSHSNSRNHGTGTDTTPSNHPNNQPQSHFQLNNHKNNRQAAPAGAAVAAPGSKGTAAAAVLAEAQCESNLEFNVTTIESSQELFRLAIKSPKSSISHELLSSSASSTSTTPSKPYPQGNSPLAALASWSKLNPGHIKSTTALDDSTALSQVTESQVQDQSDQLSSSVGSSPSPTSDTGESSQSSPSRSCSNLANLTISTADAQCSSPTPPPPSSQPPQPTQSSARLLPNDMPKAEVSLYTTECQREASCQILNGLADRYEPGSLPTYADNNEFVPPINTTIKVPMKYCPVATVPSKLVAPATAAASTTPAAPPPSPSPPPPTPALTPVPPPTPVVPPSNPSEIVINTTQSSPKISKRSKTKVAIPKSGSKAGVAGTRSYMRKMTGKANRNRRNNNAECLKAGPGILRRAQAADMTLTGLPVLKGEVNRILTIKEQERTKANPATPNKIRMLLEEPFTEMSAITDNLGLTGVGGLIVERMKTFKLPVKCVINVTYELPLFKVEGIETFRVPVADDLKEDISIYFDEVADKIDETKNKNGVSIVHCMAGVSRSASIVMAYLIRHHKMTLQGAFKHTKSIRSIINPNLSFLEQLTEYEFKCHGQRITKMVDHTINECTKRLPDFIINDYLDEYLPVFEEFYN